MGRNAKAPQPSCCSFALSWLCALGKETRARLLAFALASAFKEWARGDCPQNGEFWREALFTMFPTPITSSLGDLFEPQPSIGLSPKLPPWAVGSWLPGVAWAGLRDKDQKAAGLPAAFHPHGQLVPQLSWCDVTAPDKSSGPWLATSSQGTWGTEQGTTGKFPVGSPLLAARGFLLQLADPAPLSHLGILRLFVDCPFHSSFPYGLSEPSLGWSDGTNIGLSSCEELEHLMHLYCLAGSSCFSYVCSHVDLNCLTCLLWGTQMFETTSKNI